MPKKSVDTMTAEELYALALEREVQEQEEEQAARQAQIDELRDQRRQLADAHKKELAALDKQIKALGGRVVRRKGRRGGAGRSGGVSARVLEILGASGGPMATSDLRATLEGEGMDVRNLNQQLAYLKRKNKITNPARGSYAIA